MLKNMDAAKIINPGPLSTIQDEGRKGYQKFGMPVAGAMDKFSYRISNLLVGNNDDSAVIEFTMKGPEMIFLVNTVIAITGAEMAPFIDNEPIPMWQSIPVKKGNILSFNEIKSGFRGYIAMRGGIKVPELLGSSSTYLRAGIGGVNGQKLASGNILSLKEVEGNIYDFKNFRLPKKFVPEYRDIEKMHVILGPQDDLFKTESIDMFLSSNYRVTSQSDRMGYRLEGPKIEHKENADIISDGIPLGAIQVPGDGQPIILLADRQTTGGYAKIATVVSADLDKIAQLRPGKLIKFIEISLDAAYKILNTREKIIDEIEEFDLNLGLKKVLSICVSGKNYIAGVEKINE
jgi:biotin-dependent carboxylase-like uncharacterized protein